VLLANILLTVSPSGQTESFGIPSPSYLLSVEASGSLHIYLLHHKVL